MSKFSSIYDIMLKHSTIIKCNSHRMNYHMNIASSEQLSAHRYTIHIGIWFIKHLNLLQPNFHFNYEFGLLTMLADAGWKFEMNQFQWKSHTMQVWNLGLCHSLNHWFSLFRFDKFSWRFCLDFYLTPSQWIHPLYHDVSKTLLLVYSFYFYHFLTFLFCFKRDIDLTQGWASDWDSWT